MAAPKKDYKKIFADALTALAPGESKWLEDLFRLPELPNTSEQTKRKYLRELISERPELLHSVRGFFPEPGVIIELVEKELGERIVEGNLDPANRKAAHLVRSIAGPVMQRFVEQTLEDHIKDSMIHLSLADLMSFLLEEFSGFAKGAGNGLVSIAGGLNERLLMRALENGGLTKDTHYAKTGTDSKADLVIHSTEKTRENLGVEIKSYHARERLLRGLQDISGHKVGVGWFQSPSEFNQKRTRTLLQTEVAAIYMPQKCLNEVEPSAASMTTNASIAFGSKLYRPIEQFVTDMKGYNATGSLPPSLP